MENITKIAAFTKQEENLHLTWDWLISARSIIINALATKLDSNPKYLTHNVDFLNAVMNDNKYLAVASLNKAIDRINEK